MARWVFVFIPKKEKHFHSNHEANTQIWWAFNSRYLVLWIFVVYWGVLSCGMLVVASSQWIFFPHPFNVLQKMKFSKFTMHIAYLILLAFSKAFCLLGMGLGLHGINCMFIFRGLFDKWASQFDVKLPNFIYMGTFPLNAAAPSASQVWLLASAWESHAQSPMERETFHSWRYSYLLEKDHNYFSHPSLVVCFCFHLTHKTKNSDLQKGERLVIATHLNQSNCLTNQEQVLGFAMPFTSLSV
jgi:hypothetical protein